MSDAIRALEGARDASIAQINEIIRGATVKQITPERAEDPRLGGEVLRIELNGGDWLLITAKPPSPLELDGMGPAARIQVVLVTSRKTRLKAH